MKSIGRIEAAVTRLPRADNLRKAAARQACAAALAKVRSTGIPQGVYRFKTHEEADAQVETGRARVMAANARLMQRSP